MLRQEGVTQSNPWPGSKLVHHHRSFHHRHHPWARIVHRPVMHTQTSLCTRYTKTKWTHNTRNSEADSHLRI